MASDHKVGFVYTDIKSQEIRSNLSQLSGIERLVQASLFHGEHQWRKRSMVPQATPSGKKRFYVESQNTRDEMKI